MACIYAAESGEIVALYANDEEERRYGPPPAWAHRLRFDERTNAHILAGYGRDHNGHRLVGSELRHNGVLVTVNPDGEEEGDTGATLARTLRDYLEETRNPTGAQTVRAVRALCQVALSLMRQGRRVDG
jgi:hypothetical protein